MLALRLKVVGRLSVVDHDAPGGFRLVGALVARLTHVGPVLVHSELGLHLWEHGLVLVVRQGALGCGSRRRSLLSVPLPRSGVARRVDLA